MPYNTGDVCTCSHNACPGFAKSIPRGDNSITKSNPAQVTLARDMSALNFSC